MNSLEKNFTLLLTARAISFTASGIQLFAMPLFLLDLAGSGMVLGTYSLIVSLPFVIFTPFSGVLGDRYNKKTIIFLSDLAKSIITIILLVLSWTGNLRLPFLFLMLALSNLVDNMSSCSFYAIIPDLVYGKLLPKANAGKAGCENISMIAGPLLGGLIYGTGGIKYVLLFSSLLFLTSSFAYSLLVYKNTGAPNFGLSPAGFFKDLKELIVSLKNNLGLQHLLICIAFLNFLSAPFFAISLPFLFKQVLGLTSQRIGLLQTCSIVGMLAGNIIFAALLSRSHIGKIMKGSAVLQNVSVVFLALASFPALINCFGPTSFAYTSVVAIFLVTIGLLNSLVNVPMATNIQITVKPRMLARFNSLTSLIFNFCYPLGSLLIGFLLDRVPAHLVLIGQASVLLVFIGGFVFLASPEVFSPPDR